MQKGQNLMNNNKTLILCMMAFVIGQLLNAAAYDPEKHISDSNRRHYNKLTKIIDSATSVNQSDDKIVDAINNVYKNLKNTIDLESLSRLFTQLCNIYVPKLTTRSDISNALLTINTQINQLREQEKNSPENIASDLADLLIEQSYFSPEMQYSVTSYMNSGLFELNVLTGKVRNIPKVADMVEGKLNADGVRDPYSDEVGRKNALHAALEATKTAKFLAGLNAAYAMVDDNMVFAPTLNSNWTAPLDPNLLQALNARENSLKSALGYDDSWFQWITDWSLWVPKSLTSMIYATPTRTRQATADTPQLHFNPYQRNPQANDVIVRIPDSLIKSIIKTNADYKQKINSQEAANLLIKQCFIAQQTFDEDTRLGIELNAWPVYCMPAKTPISTAHYIFDQLEIAPGKYANTIDLLCDKITSAGFCHHNKTELHMLLLQIRKAVQTAMFIANKDSSYNAGYKLSSGISQYLDRIIGYLAIYDNKLDALCKNQDFGGSRTDIMRSAIWSRISNIAMGAAALGAVGIATFGGYKAIGAVGTGAKNAYHGIFGNPADKSAVNKTAADKAFADKVAAEIEKIKINQQPQQVASIATQTDNQQESVESMHEDDEDGDMDMDDDDETGDESNHSIANNYMDIAQNKLLNFFTNVVSEGKITASNFANSTTKNFMNSIASENSKTREIDKADPEFMYSYKTPDNFDYAVGATAAAAASLGSAIKYAGSVGDLAGQGALNGIAKFGKPRIQTTPSIPSQAISISDKTATKTALDKLKSSNTGVTPPQNTTIPVSDKAAVKEALDKIKNSQITPQQAQATANSTIDISNPSTARAALQNAGILPSTGPGSHGATFAGTSAPIHKKIGATLADGQPKIGKAAIDKFIDKVPFDVKAGVGIGVIAASPADTDIASDWWSTHTAEDNQLQSDSPSQTNTTSKDNDDTSEQQLSAYNEPIKPVEEKLLPNN